MRSTYLFVGSSLFIILAAFTHSYLGRSVVHVSYASADETISAFVSTSSLRASSQEAWIAAEVRVATTEIEAATPAVAAPTQEAVAKAKITAKKASPPPAQTPARIIIPSIGLDTRIIGMGINSKGELDVPSGSTNDVGWYAAGPKPGQMGSAVLDAHVFAAFEDLDHVKVGDEIIVETVNGARLRFVAQETTVYKLSQLTSEMLFGRDGDRWLNLITCAGSPVGDTYSHRLVVYARFVETL